MAKRNDNKFEIGGNLNNSLNEGNWGAYLDLQRKTLLSLENLESYIQEISNSKNIKESDLMKYMKNIIKNDIEELVNAIRINSSRILELLNGEEGLILLTKNEISNIENLLKDNPQIPPEVQNSLENLLKTFVSKKLRLYENLRSMIAREDTLGLNIAKYEEQSIEEYIGTIINLFKELDEIIIEKSNDEIILIKLLEITLFLENLRGNLNSEILENLKNESDELIKNDFIIFIQNYTKKYRTPIKDRIFRIREILNKKENVFMNLDEKENKEVIGLYTEFISNLFKGMKFEKEFKNRNLDSKIKNLEKEFQNLLLKLKERISKEGYGILTEQEFENLILFKEQRGYFDRLLNRTREEESSHEEKVLSIYDVEEKLSKIKETNEKELSGFLDNLISNLKIFTSEKGFKSFENLQSPVNSKTGIKNIIGMKINENKGNKLIEEYRKEFGNKLQTSVIYINNNFRNFEDFLQEYYNYFSRENKLKEYSFISLIPNLFDGQSKNKEELKKYFEFYTKISKDISKNLNLRIDEFKNNQNLIENNINILKKKKEIIDKKIRVKNLEIEEIENKIENEENELNKEILDLKNKLNQKKEFINLKIQRLEENKINHPLNFETIDNQIDNLTLNKENFIYEKSSKQILLEKNIEKLKIILENKKNEIKNFSIENLEFQNLRIKESDLNDYEIYSEILELDSSNYNQILEIEIEKLKGIKNTFPQKVKHIEELINVFKSLNIFIDDSINILQILNYKKDYIKNKYFKFSIFGNKTDKEIWLFLNDEFEYISKHFREGGGIYRLP